MDDCKDVNSTPIISIPNVLGWSNMRASCDSNFVERVLSRREKILHPVCSLKSISRIYIHRWRDPLEPIQNTVVRTSWKQGGKQRYRFVARKTRKKERERRKFGRAGAVCARLHQNAKIDPFKPAQHPFSFILRYPKLFPFSPLFFFVFLYFLYLESRVFHFIVIFIIIRCKLCGRVKKLFVINAFRVLSSKVSMYTMAEFAKRLACTYFWYRNGRLRRWHFDQRRNEFYMVKRGTRYESIRKILCAAYPSRGECGEGDGEITRSGG